MKLTDLFEMSAQDVGDLTKALEWMFKDLNIEVTVSNHFNQRVQADRETGVQKEEIINAFNKLKNKYGQQLVDAYVDHDHFVAVLKDMASDLNIPFAFHFDKQNPRNHTYTLNLITIMRKDPTKFRANMAGGAELAVEAINNITNDYEPDREFGLPKPTKFKKHTKKAPVTDRAQNSIIKTLWFYNTSDAS